MSFNQGGKLPENKTTVVENYVNVKLPINVNKPLCAFGHIINLKTSGNCDTWTQTGAFTNTDVKFYLQTLAYVNPYDGLYWIALGI